MLLKEFCTTEVAYCSREMTVAEAAQVMRKKHLGDLVVVDDADDDFSPVGLITDRDIAVKVVGNELDPRKTTVGEIMRTPLVTASEDEDSSVAIGRMRNHGVRRLPITRGHGKLAGIVTLDDLLSSCDSKSTLCSTSFRKSAITSAAKAVERRLISARRALRTDPPRGSSALHIRTIGI